MMEKGYGSPNSATSGAPRLTVADVSCGYGDSVVLNHVSFSVSAGEVCCILGPNGVGKTTLFKSILGTLPLLGGHVLLDGEDTSELTRIEIARKVGYVPQAHTPPFPFTVLDVVEMGRASHVSLLSSPSAHDREVALEALNTLGIAHLQDRLYTQISGGERQMVILARALAQQADILVMDEPTANLDFGNQIEVLSYVRQLASAGLSVIMTTHAPDHVFWCADKVVAVQNSEQVTIGTVENVMNDELPSTLYNVDASIVSVQTGAKSTKLVVPSLGQARPERTDAISRFLELRDS